MNYVYVLYSGRDGNLYVGKTVDIYERLERHNNGRVVSTRNRRPLVLVHLEVYENSGEADKRERELKTPSAGRFKRELKEKLRL